MNGILVVLFFMLNLGAMEEKKASKRVQAKTEWKEDLYKTKTEINKEEQKAAKKRAETWEKYLQRSKENPHLRSLLEGGFRKPWSIKKSYKVPHTTTRLY
jgi:predicted YcjX-like family ATPase